MQNRGLGGGRVLMEKVYRCSKARSEGAKDWGESVCEIRSVK